MEVWGIPGRGRIQEQGPWGGNNLGMLKQMKGQYGWSIGNKVGWSHILWGLMGHSKEMNYGLNVAWGLWRILAREQYYQIYSFEITPRFLFKD